MDLDLALSAMDHPSSFERRGVSLHERSRDRFATGASIRTGTIGSGGPGLLVVTRNAGFGVGLARLAEMQHLNVTLCWSTTDVEQIPFWSFAAVIVDRPSWSDLQRVIGSRVAAALGRIPLILVDVNSEPLAQNVAKNEMAIEAGGRIPSRIVAVTQLSQGPIAALDAALKALNQELDAPPTSSAIESPPHADIANPAGLPRHQHKTHSISSANSSQIRVAIIEDQRAIADLLLSVAQRRGVAADLYVDVAHYREHAARRPADVVILRYDPGPLRGIDLDTALAATLGPVPAVLLSTETTAALPTEPAAPAGGYLRFIRIKRTTPPDEIFDAVLTLAERAVYLV